MKGKCLDHKAIFGCLMIVFTNIWIYQKKVSFEAESFQEETNRRLGSCLDIKLQSSSWTKSIN